MKAQSLLIAGLAVVGLAITAVGLSASPAFATQFVDFACSSTLSFIPCTTATISGTVTQSGANYSSGGIAVWNDMQYSLASPFDLSFNTATKTLDITGTGVWAGQNFTGTFASFSVHKGAFETVLTFDDTTFSLSPAAASKLGGPLAEDITTVGFFNIGPGHTTSTANSVDAALQIVPEPSALTLFGPGVLGLGGMVLHRRRIRAL